MASEESSTEPTTQPTTTKPRRVVRRRRPHQEETPSIDSVLLENTLRESSLPSAYDFELPKTVQRILALQASHVALQMPEGLLLYATVIGDILKRLCSCVNQISVLADVTYGACCVEDLTAKALGAQLLVHYGHSCLVPLQHTVVPCLYVFVEIQIDTKHMVECLDVTIQKEQLLRSQPIYLLGTIQFRHAFASACKMLQDDFHYSSVSIPQVKPLSPGEVLGCTSPVLSQDDGGIVCFVADGRFHLESTLISNPHIQHFYRYDPYSKTLTRERYKHDEMKTIRMQAIQRAKHAKTFGIVLGTLGRQGNPAIVKKIRDALSKQEKKSFLMLLSEITPAKLKLFDVDAWVQVACPRLSVDWGHFLCEKPVLTPYELFVCVGETDWKEVYPMDYYSQAGGPWSNYGDSNKDRQLDVVTDKPEKDCGTDCNNTKC